jgi:tetratricopeptide (TPR) repeat protein
VHHDRELGEVELQGSSLRLHHPLERAPQDLVVARVEVGVLLSMLETAGRLAEATPLYERALTDCERILGAEHPDTLTSRDNLASAYEAAGRLGEATPLYERALTDRERILGADHPDTLTSRTTLAAAERVMSPDD